MSDHYGCQVDVQDGQHDQFDHGLQDTRGQAGWFYTSQYGHQDTLASHQVGQDDNQDGQDGCQDENQDYEVETKF